MFSRVKRIAMLSMAAGAVFCAGGCDQTAEADKNLTSALSQANVIRDPADAQFAGAMTALQDASRDNVSPAIKAQAKSKLASMERQQADELLRAAALKDIAAARIAMQVLQASSQVQATNLQIDTYKKLDPGTVKAEIQKMINTAKGGAEQINWIGEGDSAIPTEAASQQKVSKLEGEIAQRQEQIRTLTEQRAAAIQQAEQYAKQSEDAKGQESVDAFKKASDTRKTASDLGTQIDLLSAQLIPVQKDLEIAQGQQAAASEAVKQLQDQMKLLDETWQAIQQQVAAQTTLAKEIVSTDGAQAVPAVEGTDTSVGEVAGKSLTAKADAISKLSEEADALREQAREKLDGAASKQAEAFTALSDYKKVLGEIEAQPSLAANAKNALDLGHTSMSLQQYKLAEASIAQAIGRLNLSKAMSLATRLMVNEAVEPVLTQAGQTVPASLGKRDDLTAKVKEAISLTAESLKSADEKFSNTTSPKTQVDRLAQATALVQSALVRYDLHRCALLAGNKEEAATRLTEAQDQIKAAAESNAYFPALPSELAEVIPKPVIPEASATPESSADTTGVAGDDLSQAKALMVKYADAISKNSMDSLQNLSVIEGGAESFELSKSYAVALARFTSSVESKLGAENAQVLQSRISSLLRQAFIATIVSVEGDTATMASGFVQMRKVEGAWKLVFAPATTDAQKADIQVFSKNIEAMDSISSQIDAGTITTLEQLMQEFQKAMAGGTPTPGSSSGGPSPATGEDVTQLTQLMDRFGEALAKNDVDSIREVASITPEGEQVVELYKAMATYISRLGIVIEGKFGVKTADQFKKDIGPALAKVFTDGLKVEGDKGINKSGAAVAVKADGAWKMLFAVPETEEQRAGVEAGKQMVEKFGNLALRLETGELTTLQQVNDELKTLVPSMPALVGEAPAAAGETPAPPAGQETPPPQQ